VYEFFNERDMRSEFAEAANVRHCPYRRSRRLEFVSALARLLREESVDVVLSHAFGNHALVAIAARMAGVPRTYVIVTADPVSPRRTRWRMFALAQGARPICDAEIAVSESVGKALVDRLHLPSHRVRVIPNGCDVMEVGRRAAEARSAAARHDGWRILMVSRIDRPKDHVTLLRAVAFLRAEGLPAELSLAGDGGRREEYKALARQLGIWEHTHFLGNRSDVPELLGSSDVLVLATESEGLPIALLEGMAACIPVVATDIPPCRETLDDGRCGTLAPRRDPEALARALKEVLLNPPYRERLVQAASRRVRDHYDVPMMVERYARLLRGG
jgi:glycosyltransferase involved in cell wall biosynthesis